MNDGIIKGTGNSRYLKGCGWPSTYAEFKAMAEAGTLPFDFNGINATGWQQLATALSKANLLSDTTAAKLGDVTTVDAALALLARLNGGLGNEYVWSKTKTEASLSLGSSTQFRTDNSVNLVITVYETAVANLDGTITLSESSTYRSNEHTGYHTDCAGKYYQYSGNIYCLTSVTSSTIEGKHYLDGSLVSVVVTNTNYGYVNSPSSDAYPPAVSDGYTYTALGQLGEKMQIATGSYTGTGTYGSSYQNTLTFSFEPKIVFIFPKSYASVTAMLIAVNPSPYGICVDQTNTTTRQSTVSWSGNSVSWYNGTNAGCQQNSAISYEYVAIG